MNEWALTAAAVIGLASVGALTGLAAFGQAGSDAAKIIPIAGGFATGIAAWFDNKTRAKNYTLAANKIDTGLAEAMASVVDGTDAKFRAATGPLYKVIGEAERELETKRTTEVLETAEDRLKAAELKQQELERKLEDLKKQMSSRPTP